MDEAPFSVTVKTKAGNLVTVRGTDIPSWRAGMLGAAGLVLPPTAEVSIPDVIATLEEAITLAAPGAVQHQQALNTVQQAFPAAQVVGTYAGAPSVPQQPQQYANAGTDPVGPQGVVTCDHGQMQFKSGNRKSDGQYWQGYVCPQGVKECKIKHYQNHQ